EEHAGEDRKRKEAVEARNRGDALVYEIEKNLKEHGGKLDAALKGRIEEALVKLKDALKGDDSAAITAASESLQQVWHEAAASLYQTAGAGAPQDPSGAPQPEPKKSGSGAVDADFEVMN